ncbi:MAG: hypothetical protein QOI25_2623 [Mycobacterium sp.]|jgi:hypothetical protein|nr:hypothetical protein [Mycobacterium sp.]
MPLLREAFYGARRFDDPVSRAGLSSMAGSARPKEFVSAGLMVKGRTRVSPKGLPVEGHGSRSEAANRCPSPR